MSIIATIFSKLFARTPAHHESAYGPFYSDVVARLTRAGVTVGRTSFYPRIEVHSITESERLDKEGQLRQFQFTVESIGNASLAATAAMNEANIELLTSEISLPEGWRCLGIIPGQLQDLTESADTAKIIYRLLQGFTAWVELVKAEPAAQEPAPQGQEEAGEANNEEPVIEP